MSTSRLATMAASMKVCGESRKPGGPLVALTPTGASRYRNHWNRNSPRRAATTVCQFLPSAKLPSLRALMADIDMSEATIGATQLVDKIDSGAMDVASLADSAVADRLCVHVLTSQQPCR